MKILTAVTVLLVLVTVTAHAQKSPDGVPPNAGADIERPGAQLGADERLQRMQKRLGLSDEQVAQLREIRQRGGSREEVRAVFTDEQWAMMQERRRQANARRGKNNPGQFYKLPPDHQPQNADDG